MILAGTKGPCSPGHWARVLPRHLARSERGHFALLLHTFFTGRCYSKGENSGNGDTFYSYYSFDVLQNDKTDDMLSVNGYTSAVWYHTWLGDSVFTKSLEQMQIGRGADGLRRGLNKGKDNCGRQGEN